MKEDHLIEVQDLSVSFGNRKKKVEVLHGISFNIPHKSIVGIVGESGSGKSVTSMAIMRLLPKQTAEVSGEVMFSGEDILKQDDKEMRAIRGREIAMIFQEPMSTLNPSLTCGFQVSEILKHHLQLSSSAAKKETIQLFERVKLPRPRQIFNSYPHQISGGQMQRVVIAMAIACKPKLLIADEPTTALDVTVQKEIISLLKELQQETGMSLLFISHDLNLVSELANEVIVMYHGDIVEKGSVDEIFKNPKEDYTKALLASRPDTKTRLKVLPTIASLSDNTFVPEVVSAQQRAMKHKRIYTQAPLLEVHNLEKTYFTKTGFFSKKGEIRAVDHISFQVFEGETLGLVGESGCGKSTLGKAILLLEKASAGSIKYRGKEITKLSSSETRKLRQEIQLIFQDPFSSLNPRILIGEALVEVMQVHSIGTSAQNRKDKAMDLLCRVGLDESYFSRYPHELSGGQRQRVGIARTVAMQPKLVICDESVSALDISVQAQVLNLLNELKEDFGFTYIFISHDLAVVRFMADQLMVMNSGRIEEMGDADEIYSSPNKEYTKRLIDSIPKGIE